MKARFTNNRAKRLYSGRFAPSEPGSAGYDLRIAHVEASGLVHTGVSVAIPDGYVGLILPRSGLGFKYGLGLKNTAGVIDASYRGELMLKMSATGSTLSVKEDRDNDRYLSVSSELHLTETAQLVEGDRIAQMIIVSCRNRPADVVDELPQSDRGEDGFGSTGLS